MLKKIFFGVAVITSMAASAFATTGFIGEASVSAVTFKPSNNVKVAYLGDVVATNPQSYMIAAKHASGDTYYATSNLTSLIYKKQVAANAGVALTGADDTNLGTLIAGETVFTGFTAQ